MISERLWRNDAKFHLCRHNNKIPFKKKMLFHFLVIFKGLTVQEI